MMFWLGVLVGVVLGVLLVAAVCFGAAWLIREGWGKWPWEDPT